MDIILELCDTFVADYCYAYLLPASTPSAAWQSTKHAATSTFSSLREGATPISSNGYTWHPATAYYSLEPSKYAYMSAWPRDNTYRQALSLYLITWCVAYPIYMLANPR